MLRNLGSIVVALAMLASSPALAQDEAGPTSGGATSGGATSGGVTTGAAAPETLTPNAPVQSVDQGPVPAGGPAGTAAASAWTPGPVTLAIGAAVIGGAVCLAVCGGSSNHSTTTTTRSPK
jgi:hypothetical protein